MCADFNFWMNRSGARGRQGVKGDKGEAGYSPYIDIKSNTPTEFIMTIHNETESFDTPNLIPTAIGEKVTEMDAVLTTHTEDIANLKLDITAIKNKDNAQDSDIAALKTRVGGTEESIEDLNHKYTVLGSEVSDLTLTKQDKLVEGANITLTDNADGTTTISASGGGGGGGTPENMMTIDTNQTVSGVKTFTNRVDIGISGLESRITTTNNSESGQRQDLSIVSSGDLALSTGDVAFTDADGGSHIRQGKIIDSDGNIVLSQGNVTAGNNITITKTSKGVQIASSGGGSSEPPANMVTTDTNQDITGIKTFKGDAGNNDPSIIIGGRRTGLADVIGGKIKVNGNDNFEISTGGKGANSAIFRLNKSTDNDPCYFEFTSNTTTMTPTIRLGNQSYQGTIKYDVSYPSGFLFETQNSLSGYAYSSFKIADDVLTFKKTDGTVVDLLAGGSAPENMVTTDTDQFITGTKSFYSSINLKSSETDNYYSMITNTGGSIKLQAQYGNPAGLNIQTDDVQFIDFQGISHSLLSQSKLNADEYYYKAGDVFTSESYAVVPAAFSSTKTQILMSIPMPKSMKNVSNISITKCVLSVRVPSGGYLPSGNFDFLADANTTITAYKAFDNLLTLRMDNTKGWGTQVPNNIPITVQINPASLIVEFN